MGFGNVTTTTGAGGQGESFGQTTTTTTTTTEGGPYLCIELDSNIGLEIALTVDQRVKNPTGPFLPDTILGDWGSNPNPMVDFIIDGFIRIKGKSVRTCLPKEVAENLAGQTHACKVTQFQDFKALGMGGDEDLMMPMPGGVGGISAAARRGVLPLLLGRTSKAWPYATTKICYKGKPFPFPFKIIRKPGTGLNDPPGVISTPGIISTQPALLRPSNVPWVGYGTVTFETGVVWKVTHSWKNWAFLIPGTESYHAFHLNVVYEKDCGPAICGPCAPPIAQQTGGIFEAAWPECKTKALNILSPINIRSSMPLLTWENDNGPNRRKGYLVANDPYLEGGCAYPASPEISLPSPPGQKPGTNVLVQGEGPLYARYPGFGADIFEGNRQNAVSQGLHQVKQKIKELLQEAEDIYCGSLSISDANIDGLLQEFADKWKENSAINDKISTEPDDPAYQPSNF